MARARFGLILSVALWLASPQGHAGIALPLSQPSWSELTQEQKHVLAPLSGEWDKMEGFRRKKWLGIAQRYQSLNPDEQARMQRRMTDWAKLTPDERKRARDKYKSLQKDAPEKKEAVKLKWQEYTDLPESEKARLKAEAVKKPTPRPAPSKTSAPKAATGSTTAAAPSATSANQAVVRQ
jgi:hypothetical protein